MLSLKARWKGFGPVVFVSSLALVACEDTTNPPPVTGLDGGADASLDAPVQPTDGSADAADASDASESALSDREIVAVLVAINTGEISEGQLAASMGTDARVREYGAAMVTMHTAANTRLATLNARLGGEPSAPSSLRQMLTADAASTRATLAALRGSAFDQAYAASQVRQHTRALDVINSALVPNAADTELRTALTSEVAPMVSSHLQQARELVVAVGTP